MRGHAIANSIFVAACNRVGVEDGQGFYGRSFVADPAGQLIAEAGRGTEQVVMATLQRETLRAVRDTHQFLRDRRPESYGGLLKRSLGE
jgi:N-carbamoylputrescine amidase